MDSLLSRTKNPAEIDSSLWKLLFIATLGVLSSFVAGYFIRNILISYGPQSWVAVGISTLIFILIFVIQAFCIKSKSINWWVVFLETVGLLFFFLGSFSYTLTVGILIILLILLKSTNQIILNELKNKIKIKFLSISARAVSKILTALALFVSISYAGLLYNSGQLFTPSQLKIFLAPVESIMKSVLLDNFSMNMTIDNFVESLVMKQLTDSEKTLVQQSPALKQSLINKSIDSLRLQAGNLGIYLEPSKTILQTTSEILKVDNLSNIINQKFENIIPLDMRNSIKPGIFAIVGVLMFLVLIGFKFIFVIPITLLAWLFYEILFAFNFLKLMYQPQNQEIILL